MLGKQSSLECGKRREQDGSLSALLQEWKGIESPANFEAEVWRRIRTASVPERRGVTLAEFLRDWLRPQPAWATGLAAALAVLVGIWVGVSTPLPRDGRQANEPLLHAQTLAGLYLTMMAGGSR